MVMDGGEGEKIEKCCVVKDIEHQQKKEKMTELQRMKGLAHLSIRRGQTKEISRKGGIDPMCLVNF